MLSLYQQIASDIKNDILSQSLKVGARLPSIRSLCNKYNCSKGTVIKAYDELQSQNIIYSIPQSGYYVVDNMLYRSNNFDGTIDLSNGIPQVHSIYTPNLRHCLDNTEEIHALNSSNFYLKGKDSLIELVPSYLADSKVFTFKENIYINLGIGQVFSILSNMAFPNNGETILVEQPTYKYLLSYLTSNKIKVKGIARDKNGIDLNELERIFKYDNIKFFYTVPRNHNPLGTYYSKNERIAIANLAKKYDVYIVEDDYFADIEFDKKYDPIFSYSDYEHTIYLRSFSKIIPWLRLGISVIPTKLIPIFEKHVAQSYYNSYFSASFVCQSILEMYLKSNLLKKHTNEIRQTLITKQNVLKNHKLFQSNLLSYDSSGVYSYIYINNRIKEKFVLENLKAQKVLIASGDKFFLDKENYPSGIRISIAKPNENELKKGLDIIYNEIFD